MALIPIKTKEDKLSIVEFYRQCIKNIKDERERLKGDDSNHGLHRRLHLDTKIIATNRQFNFFNSNKVDTLLDKGFDLKFNGAILKIDTKNQFWGEFNYYPKCGKLYAKNWKKWYENSWSWIDKKLINNDKI
jgi:hypothetical protein